MSWKCPNCNIENADLLIQCPCGYMLPSDRLDIDNEPDCSLCNEPSETKCNHDSIEELEVTDYKIKGQSAIGFPSGERQTTQGWKIKHRRSINTYICDRCAAKAFSKRNKKIAPYIAAVTTLISIGLVVWLIKLIFNNGFDEHGGLVFFLILFSAWTESY